MNLTYETGVVNEWPPAPRLDIPRQELGGVVVVVIPECKGRCNGFQTHDTVGAVLSVQLEGAFKVGPVFRDKIVVNGQC